MRKKTALVLDPLRAAKHLTRHEDGIVSSCRAHEQEVGGRLAQEWSELAALTFDQEARATPMWLPCGRIALCPVTALEARLAAAKIDLAAATASGAARHEGRAVTRDMGTLTAADWSDTQVAAF